MIPIEFPEKNFTFQKPANMTDEECSSLDVWKGLNRDGHRIIISAWKPSYEDLQALNSGGVIYLELISSGLPPVSMYTENPFVTNNAG